MLEISQQFGKLLTLRYQTSSKLLHVLSLHTDS